MSTLTPTHYTIVEGGYWLQWRFGEVDMDILNKYYNYLYKTINGQPVHSLRFTLGTDSYAMRWDSINGWTK